MQDIHAALESIYLQITLIDVSLQFKKGGGDGYPWLKAGHLLLSFKVLYESAYGRATSLGE